MENLVNEKNSFERIFSLFERKLEELGAPLPSVSLIAAEDNDPYRILASTIISLRTRDAVTLSASMRLFESFPDIKSLKEGDISKIEEAIKPAGFYRRKAQQLKTIARIIYDEYGGKVPDDIDKLMELPGVGIKTASLVLNLGYGIDAICVDCHVHQIANRLGWVDTSSPEETEKVARKKALQVTDDYLTIFFTAGIATFRTHARTSRCVTKSSIQRIHLSPLKRLKP